MSVEPTRIQVRRDTSVNWWTANTILNEGEIGYETDTGNFKIGKLDVTKQRIPWRSLNYSMGSGVKSKY